MAVGDFLQGVGRAGRATAIGALKGRRQALDRAEEERKTRTIERQRDVQNELMGKLRDAQTEELAQLGTERRAKRDALAAERTAQVNAFRDRYRGTDREFGPDVSEDRILIEGDRFAKADALKEERDNAKEVASALAASRRTSTGSTARTEPQRIQAESVAAARRQVTTTLAGIADIFSGKTEGPNVSDKRTPAERGQAAHAFAVQQGYTGIQQLIDRAEELANAGGGSAQEVWDEAAAELGGTEAAVAALGPRPSS